MEIGIELIPYTKRYDRSQGWGCGYVKIPKGHPILIKIELGGAFEKFPLYKQGFSNEITFGKWDEDREFYTIGFDTMHTYNSASDDEAYVLKTTLEMKEIVENYTIEDGKEDINEYVAELKEALLEDLAYLEIDKSISTPKN